MSKFIDVLRGWKFRVAAFGGSVGTVYVTFVTSHGHHPGHPLF